MKIINELENDKDWSIKRICTGKGFSIGNCSSLLLVEKNDVKLLVFKYEDRDTEYNFYFKCPVCGGCTNLSKNAIPSSIKRKLFIKEGNREYNSYRE